MKNKKYSLGLADILRDRIDECAKFKRHQKSNLETIKRILEQDLSSKEDEENFEE